MGAAIERAKTFERRRCGHLMDEDALSERECMLSVVDPKGNGQNKFRYVVITQDEELVCLVPLCCLPLSEEVLTDSVNRGRGYGRWFLHR